MSRFFIRRPIVAIVIAILTVFVGALTILRLPIAQFPDIVPPEVMIRATFVGADGRTIAQSVATPIEEEMSGVDNMNYMYSLSSTSNSQMSMTVDFAVGTDPNTDLILSQMRETQAAPQIPSEVSRYGLITQKSLTSPLMLVALDSPHDTYSAQFLANYAYINLLDPITRLHGIGNVQVFGSGQYAMRIWLDPNKMTKLGVTVSDVVDAVEAQNTVNPAGQIGAEPAPPGQQLTFPVLAQGRLVTPQQFGNIIVRETPNGGIVRVKDIGKVELGTQFYNLKGRLNGKPSAIIALYQLPGSNAVDDAREVRDFMAKAKAEFPPDMSYAVSLDQTLSVSEGMKEILITLAIALALVIFVVYLFLQNWRATLIPLLAVPVSLVGTFILFPLIGFSINTLSMFAMVLAIGLVVDDAIVVVEGVQRHIEEGLAPRDAARAAMDELSGPVVGIALVLASVFVPTALIPGITGRLYQQFAVTIAVSVVISAFNALSLSPALAGLLLRPRKPGRGPLALFFGWFNRTFNHGSNLYIRVSRQLIRKSVVAMILLALFFGAAAFLGEHLPTSFLPNEDYGYMFVNLQLPNDASLQRTSAVAHKVEQIVMKTPGVRYVTSVIGFSLLSTVQAPNSAFFFVRLQPWSQRTKMSETVWAIEARLNAELSSLPQATAFTFAPPAIPGVGTAGGFTFVLEDRAGKGISYLSANLGKFMAAARKQPEIGSIFSTFVPNMPEKFARVDRAEAMKMGVPLPDLYTTLQAYLGGIFVNYFNRFGRQWQVYVEGGPKYRSKPSDLSEFYVRNDSGQMVPLSALVKFKSMLGPQFVMHYNEFDSAEITGTAAPGYSSDQVTAALEKVFKQTMPPGMGYGFMGMSYQEQKAAQGVSATQIFGMSLLFVFLILAALYESWSLPFSVLLSTPVAVFGAFGVLLLRRMYVAHFYPPYMQHITNDVYSQIGLVMLIGLAAKNAILIVEFAKKQYEQGKSLTEAALGGARLRLRPILMTSFAFILGVVPLWVASGTGSISRQIMGTTVIGGMLAATVIGIFFVPAIFYVVERISGARRTVPAAELATGEASGKGD
jgi:HAE1 family hydrophobic/amphiphilic exporter-1